MTAPDRMAAAVYRDKGQVEVDEIPVPSIGAGDVLVEVSHCGICGTDIHMILEGWSTPGAVGGHEWSGVVAAVGTEVEGFAVGDAVVGAPDQTCGACMFCRTGRPSLCAAREGLGGDGGTGAFARFKRSTAGALLKVPDGVPVRVAALTEPLAVALHAISLSGAQPGDRVLVTGAGPIGTLSIAALRATGIDDITVSEPLEARRALAEELGATAVTPDELVAPRIAYELVDAPYDVALECSGRGDAVRAAMAQLRRAGTLVLVGTGMDHPRLDTNRVILNELVVTGSFNYDAGGFERALELLAAGRVPVDVLIEPEDVPLEGLVGALDRLVSGAAAGKVLIAPGQGRD